MYTPLSRIMVIGVLTNPFTFGEMALGYVFSRLFIMSKPDRTRLILRIGLGITVLFLVIRAINVYGDPHPWSVQPDGVWTFLSFLNCEKYPPSLLYLLMTLGPSILLLGLLEIKTPRLIKPLTVFGSVPLFYYLVHFAYIILLATVGGLVHGNPQLIGILPGAPTTNLSLIYAVWLFVVLSLYPVCRWYQNLKKAKSWWWLKYI